MVDAITAAEMESVMEARSSEASGSSEPVSGRVEVLGDAARLASSTELEGTGAVTMIVGGRDALSEPETEMCRIPG